MTDIGQDGLGRSVLSILSLPNSVSSWNCSMINVSFFGARVQPKSQVDMFYPFAPLRLYFQVNGTLGQSRIVISFHWNGSSCTDDTSKVPFLPEFVWTGQSEHMISVALDSMLNSGMDLVDMTLCFQGVNVTSKSFSINTNLPDWVGLSNLQVVGASRTGGWRKFNGVWATPGGPQTDNEPIVYRKDLGYFLMTSDWQFD